MRVRTKVRLVNRPDGTAQVWIDVIVDEQYTQEIQVASGMHPTLAHQWVRGQVDFQYVLARG